MYRRGRRRPAANASSLSCTSSPNYRFFFFESEAVFFLKLSFPKATKGEDSISAVMLMARVEGGLIHVPVSVQS